MPVGEEQAKQDGDGEIQVPENFPEKFLKDGKPDFNALTSSYTELETLASSKGEDVVEAYKAEQLKARPETAEKYEVPEFEDVNMDELNAHPLLGWWREEAFNRGLSNEDFQKGVNQYIESQQPDLDGEMKKLGDNANVRINALGTWLDSKYGDDPATYEQLNQMTRTAEGVAALEKIMRGDANYNAPGGEDKELGLTAEQLKEWQADPRYWNSSKRDPAFVKKVDEGYAKLYGKK